MDTKAESWHGTDNGYTYHKCRCKLCRVARSEYIGNWRKVRYPDRKPYKVNDPTSGLRYCPQCKETKPLEDFHRNARRSMGRASECKPCHYARSLQVKATPHGRFGTYRADARNRDIPFLINLEEFKTFWQVPCHYCGGHIDTIGLDRIDSNGAYELTNILSCCSQCNRAKGTLSSEEFVDMCSKVSAHISRLNTNS